jgi:hypothetical protein
MLDVYGTRYFASQIKIDSIFTSYRIQSNASNEITMSLSAEALLAALRSASSSASSGSSYETEEVVMKLAKKKDQAALSFEISGTTKVGRKVRVAHDVKIEVMKPGDVARLAEPLCPEPDVRFCSQMRDPYQRSHSDSHPPATSAETSNNRRQASTYVRHPSYTSLQ